jgi:hypothetical protein
MGFTSFNPSYALMLLAPAGTLRPIVDKLNAALAGAKLQKIFADGGMDEHPPEEETPEARPRCSAEVIRANHISGQ